MTMAFTAFLVLLVVSPATVYGADFTVGDSDGWNTGVDYSSWTSGKTFTVGDKLVFKYDSSHIVDEVPESDYTGCTTTNLIKTYSTSPTTITLSKAGPNYFICSIPGHCTSGMKVMVNVVAAGTPSTTPAPPTATPAPPTTTTPANNDSPPPPPPPPKGTSAASSLNMNLVGVPLVLATLIAVMV